MKKKISIFGSTGSIGNSSLKLFKNNKKTHELYILTANKNFNKIIYQIKIFKPKIFIIFDYNTYIKVKKIIKNKKILILNSHNYYSYKFKKSDVAISAIPGIAGLEPTLHLIKICKKLLIANKESVICGWNLINSLSKKKR